MSHLSAEAQLISECGDEIREYLRANPGPFNTPDLISTLKKRAREEGKAESSLDYGASPMLFTTRGEAYGFALWSLRGGGEVLTQNRTWLQCWHEHVPQDDRHNWWGGDYD